MIGTITRMFAAIDGNDWDGLAGFFSPACVYERPGYAPIEGLARLERFYREERRIGAGRHLIHDSFEKPGRLLVTGSFAGTSRDGEPLTAEFVDVYRFAGDLIAHRRTFFYAPLI